MTTTFQVVLDCHDNDVLLQFWSTALHYVRPDPPEGFDTWTAYWRHFDLPEEEVDDSPTSVVDPDGIGPRLVFQVVPEDKVVKNRLHLDLRVSGGPQLPLDVRRQRVDAEAERLIAAGATKVRVLENVDHYAIAMLDPEGNEFDLN